MLQRISNQPDSERRRAIILLVVLALLTLFAIVGLAFVFYAGSEASSSRIYRETLDMELATPDIAPSTLLNFAIPQILFDVPDDATGVYSAMRGHSLGRDMFGENYTGSGPFVYANNVQPFNGVGKLHTASSAGPAYPFPAIMGNPYGADDAALPNYTWFSSDNFLRDPERIGARTGSSAVNNPPGAFTGGWNTPYTYPDANHMYLGAVRADGTLLVQSFYRPWQFNATLGVNALTAPTSAPNDWLTPQGKYQILRPRPIDMGPGFPYPTGTMTYTSNPVAGTQSTIVTGDVQNFPGSNGADSLWMDLDYPVQTLWNGQLYKPLFAFFIQDLDGRVNVNAHGNVRGVQMPYPPVAGTYPGAPVTFKAGPHFSGPGWGKWEINLSQVLTGPGPTPNPNEWTNLFFGNSALSTPLPGRYGTNGVPESPQLTASPGFYAHLYAMADLDCSTDPNPVPPGPVGGGTPSGPYALPAPGATAPFPAFPAGYQNGSTAERTYHPMLYDLVQATVMPFTPASPGGDLLFPVGDQEDMLLAYGGVGSPGGPSFLRQMCPQNFNFADKTLPATDPTIKARQRICSLVTTDSFDLDLPGITPWIFNQADPLNLYLVGGAGTPNLPPVGPALGFPPLTGAGTASPAGYEFGAGWQAANPSLPHMANTLDPTTVTTLLSKVDVNRFLAPYPHMGQGTNPGPYDYWNTPPTNPNGYLPYPPPPSSGVTPLCPPNGRFDSSPAAMAQFLAATQDRQSLANDIYRRLLVVTGVRPVAVPTAPTEVELMPRRWLAQLAVNIVDYIDEDDISTPFNFYTTSDGLAAANIYDMFVPSNPDTLKYWVFGTELPRVVINEVLAEYKLPPPVGASTTWTGPFVVNFWVELFNPLPNVAPASLQNTQQQDANTNPVALGMPTGPTPAYAPYKLAILRQFGLPGTVSNNANVLGSYNPDNTLASNNVRTETADSDFTGAMATFGGGAAPSVVLGPQQYLLAGPPGTGGGAPLALDARSTVAAIGSAGTNGRVPVGTPALPTPHLQYSVYQSAEGTSPPSVTSRGSPGTWYYEGPGTTGGTATTGSPITDYDAAVPPGASGIGVTVALRRLANPHLPLNPTVSAGYPVINPYATVDYMDYVPLQNATIAQITAEANKPSWAAVGKIQPYASFTYRAAGTTGTPTNSGVVDQAWPTGGTPPEKTKHTLGLTGPGLTGPGGSSPGNYPGPAGPGGMPGPGGLPSVTMSDWLVHLDRQVSSNMELLMVSGYHPHELTHQFIAPPPGSAPGTAVQRFQYLVPWLASSATSTNRLYRIFEFLEAHDPAAGVKVGGRTPGRININTFYDPDILAALCDPSPNNAFAGTNVYNPAAPPDPATIYGRLMSVRTPALVQPPGSVPPGQYITPNDRPLYGFGVGTYQAGPPAGPELQFPNVGINNTLVGSAGPTPIFQVANPTTNPTGHPYLTTELLRKIAGNVTTRSNVFAIWMTVGFFEVTDNTTKPVKLGAEVTVGASSQTIRHQMLVIVDRTNMHLALPNDRLTSTTGPVTPLVVSTPGSPTFVPKSVAIPVGATSGANFNTAWSIQPGCVVLLDQGPAQETVQVSPPVTGDPPNTFRGVISKPHSAGVAVTILGNPGPAPPGFNYTNPNYAPVIRFYNVYK